MITSFKGEYTPFWIRLIKKLAPIILLLLFVAFKIEYGKPIFTNYKLYWYIFMVACFLIGLFYHVRDIRTIVTEVGFSESEIRILGYDFNSKFEDHLKIDETLLEIKQKEKKKSRIYIEIYSNDKYYYINNYSDWKNETLVSFINEYKSRTTATIDGLELLPILIQK